MPSARTGFSFLQLVIAIALMAIIGFMVVPNFTRRVPQAQQKEFVDLLNTIARQAWIDAIKTGKAQKITFNLADRTLKRAVQTGAIDHDGKPIFESVAIQELPVHYVWPEQFEIQQFFVEGVDEIGQHGQGRTIEDIWFFVVPEGMAQEVIINLIDTKDTHASPDGQEISLVLNPLRVQFESYKKFQNPTSV